jgi:hypothetical protein
MVVSFAHSASLFMHTLIHTKFQLLKKEKKNKCVPRTYAWHWISGPPISARIAYYAVSGL